MKKLFKEALEDSPIIAAVKDDEGLSRCLTSDSRIIFILYGDIVTMVTSWRPSNPPESLRSSIWISSMD